MHNFWFVLTGYGAGFYYDKLEEAERRKNYYILGIEADIIIAYIYRGMKR